MPGAKNALLRSSAQSLSAQFVSPGDRKRLSAKAEALLRDGEIELVDFALFDFLLFKAPDRYSGFWFHSHEALAAAVGKSVDTVQRALARLKAVGLISWVQRRLSKGRGVFASLCNAYNFPASALELSKDALAALGRASRAAALVCAAAVSSRTVERSKPRPAAAAAPVEPLSADPPRRVENFSSSLFASSAWRSVARG